MYHGRDINYSLDFLQEEEEEEDVEMEPVAPQPEPEPENVNTTIVLSERLNTTYTKPGTFTKPLKSPRRFNHRYTPIRSKPRLLKGRHILGTLLIPM